MTITIKLNVAWNANYYSTSLEAQITLLFIAAKKLFLSSFTFFTRLLGFGPSLIITKGK